MKLSEKEREREKDISIMTKPASTHHFVLVHGVGHGAWCWFRLRALLETAGHKVTCLDLAGAGIHPSEADAVLSFDEYDKPLMDFMSALQEDEKVILVGHSAGGLSVTHAMHEFAEKIAVAIFIAATMLPSGFQSEEDMKDGMPDLSAFGDVYELKFSLGIDKPPTSVALRKEFQRRILYQSTPEENSTLASMLLRPWPAAISEARFGKGIENLKDARRVFIRTTRDNMVKPAQQDAMIRTWPPSEVLIMDTDHSPFFSAPDQLFKLIIQASSSTSKE